MKIYDILDRIEKLAASAKPEFNKYRSEAANSFDELMMYFIEHSEYSKKDRAFRLLLRIQKAMEAEGHSFSENAAKTKAQPNLMDSLSVPAVKGMHLVCTGTSCLLLGSSNLPKGLDIQALAKISELLGSRQCYEYNVTPAVSDACRKNGVNLALPKPLTWNKLENHGLRIEAVQTNDGRTLMESFVVRGLTALTLDRKTFYVTNVGMCRRWMAGLDDIATNALTR